MQNAECLFCRIIRREVPGEFVYEDNEVLAFKDIYPLAPVHLLVVPRIHIQSLNEAAPEHEKLLGQMLLVAKRLAAEFGVAETGYRLVTNMGSDGGQVVGHLHFHLLGGKALGTKIG